MHGTGDGSPSDTTNLMPDDAEPPKRKKPTNPASEEVIYNTKLNEIKKSHAKLSQQVAQIRQALSATGDSKKSKGSPSKGTPKTRGVAIHRAGHEPITIQLNLKER